MNLRLVTEVSWYFVMSEIGNWNEAANELDAIVDRLLRR